MSNIRQIDKINADIISAYQESAYSAAKEENRRIIPSGLSAVKDSISTASKNPDIAIMHLQKLYEKTNYQQISLFSDQVTSNLEQFRKLNKEKSEALKEHAVNVSTYSTWNTAKKVANYFGSAISTATGFVTFPVNPILGGVFITSGAIGLGNRVLSDTGGWNKITGYFEPNKEKQETISRQIDNTLNIASTGLGLLSFSVGAYQGIGTILSKAGSIIQQAGGRVSALINGVSSYGSYNSQKHVEKSSSVITNFEKKQLLLKNEITTKTSNIKETAEKNTGVFSKVFTMIQDLIESISKITKKRR